MEDELRSALLDRLRLCSSIKAADRAFIIDVRSGSELFAIECAISSRRGNEEIRSVADVDIRIDTITPMQSSPPTYQWFQRKQFNYVHIANSARLTRNRRKLFKRAFEYASPLLDLIQADPCLN
ncbi:hypothetical protein ColTof4_01233 [Colletotrichum tofieldiae]|nr:hypothetical protein ColTof3_08468 [Colletotrichum tofieldiae]GKT68810.1 hypothetical protein ColTof4_01233 [Colletotrichum tofieldiae]